VSFFKGLYLLAWLVREVYRGRLPHPVDTIFAVSMEDSGCPGIFPVLVFYNVTNKILKRMDTAVAFTQEYSRVSYPLGNMSTLPTGLDCPRIHTLVQEDRKERTF
jgi:hypothetical protein